MKPQRVSGESNLDWFHRKTVAQIEDLMTRVKLLEEGKR